MNPFPLNRRASLNCLISSPFVCASAIHLNARAHKQPFVEPPIYRLLHFSRDLCKGLSVSKSNKDDAFVSPVKLALDLATTFRLEKVLLFF